MMKFDVKNFKITGVSTSNAITILLIPVFILSIYLVNASQQKETIDEKKEGINLGLPNSQRQKKIISRANVDNLRENQKRKVSASIGDELEWNSSQTKTKSEEIVVNSSGKNEFVEAEQKRKEEAAQETSVYTNKEAEEIKSLLEDLDEKENKTPKQHSTTNSYNQRPAAQAQRTYSTSYAPENHPNPPQEKPKREKERIFSEGSGVIYAKGSNREMSANGRSEGRTSNGAIVNNLSNVNVKIHGDYNKVTERSKITVRTTQNCVINGHNVPLGTFLTGITSFNNNRLDIQFTALYLNNEIIPIRFQAYSKDGLKGIFIEGGVPDESRKDLEGDLIDEAASEVDVPIPVIGNVVKSFVRRKNGNRKVYVHLPSNYPLILKPL